MQGSPMTYSALHFGEENEPLDDLLEEEDEIDAHQFDPALTASVIAPFQMQRKVCSDVLFLVLFCVFMIGLLAIGFTSIRKGQPIKLLYPTDYLGRTCGSSSNSITSLPAEPECFQDVRSEECQKKVEKANKDEPNQDFSTRPYLWFMDITSPLKYGGICVSYCPGRQPQEEQVDGEPIEGDVAESSTLTSSSYCPPELLSLHNGSTLCSTKRIDNNRKYPPLSTQHLLSFTQLEYRTILKRCIPLARSVTNVTQIQSIHTSSIFNRLNSFSEVWTEMFGDLLKSWKIVLLSIVVGSVLLSSLFLILIRLVARVFVWTSVVSVFFAILIMGTVGVLEGFEINYPKQGIVRSLSKNLVSKNLYLYSGITLLVIDLLYVLIVLWYSRRINRSIAILQKSTEAVAAVPQIFLLPFVMFAGLILFMIYWFAVTIYMWSSGTVVIHQFTNQVQWDISYRVVFLYHLFGYFWFVEFWNGILKVAVASALAEWYWTEDRAAKSRIFLKFPLSRAVGRILLYHMGSIAFASLVLGTAEFLSFLLRRFINKVEKWSGGNRFVRCLGCVLQAIVAVFNAIIRWITRHAYIQIAIYGDNFWQSSRAAVNLISRNAEQMAVVDWVGDLVIFFGKCTVASISSILAQWMTKHSAFLAYDATIAMPSPIIVMALVFVLSYNVASLFLSVYSTGIDTIHQCYLIDQELSLTLPNHQLHCTDDVQKLMQESKLQNAKDGETL